MIDAKQIERKLCIDNQRVVKGIGELYQRNLIRVQLFHERGNVLAEYFETAKFYAR